MKRRYLGLLAALIPILALAGNAPFGIFGGAPTFATLPGNLALTFASAPSGSSTAITPSWQGTTGSYLVVFSDWESRSVTLTNGATTATWTGALVGTPTVNAAIDGYTATPASPTFGFTSDLGLVLSTGSGWFASDDSYGGTPFISSGCATVSALSGNLIIFQFSTTATTCTPVIQLPPAAHGWYCAATDVTHPVNFTETAASTSSCTVTATTTSGDVIQVSATPY